MDLQVKSAKTTSRRHEVSQVEAIMGLSMTVGDVPDGKCSTLFMVLFERHAGIHSLCAVALPVHVLAAPKRYSCPFRGRAPKERATCGQ